MKRNGLENKLIDNAKKRNGGQLPDERQQQFNSTAMGCALIFGITFDLVMMIYYFVTKNIERAYPYVAQLVVISIGYFLASLGNKEIQPPTIPFSKRSVNTDKSVYAFMSRIAWCMLDSLVYAIIVTLFEAYTDGRATGSLISDGIIFFVIFTILKSISCEIRVRRYREYMAMLDEEENDLDD